MQLYVSQVLQCSWRVLTVIVIVIVIAIVKSLFKHGKIHQENKNLERT